MNEVILMGRLTADPVLKATGNGVSVVSFDLAVDRAYKSNGYRETDFVPCVAWRQTAEFICRYFKKGNLMSVIGELQSRKWEKNGEKRVSWEVVIGEVHFCGGKSNV